MVSTRNADTVPSPANTGKFNNEHKSQQKDAKKAKAETAEVRMLDSDHLQNEGYRSLLGAVDKIRSNNGGAILQLPQIVVCGDQSSSKSSVLEPMTGVPFPAKDNLCTRFAAEIIMRRSDEESSRTKIRPHDQAIRDVPQSGRGSCEDTT